MLDFSFVTHTCQISDKTQQETKAFRKKAKSNASHSADSEKPMLKDVTSYLTDSKQNIRLPLKLFSFDKSLLGEAGR